MSLLQIPFLKKDESLVETKDFAHFYEESHLIVFRYLMVVCAGNQEEAEDLTSEAFLRAWEKRHQFSGRPSAALGWVIKIARNILIDHLRADKTHPTEEILDEILVDSSGNVESYLIAEEQIQQVLGAIQRLPFRQRDMLTLRYVLGWRVKKIAFHLGIPENTVSVDLRRALAKLQKQLVPHG